MNRRKFMMGCGCMVAGSMPEISAAQDSEGFEGKICAFGGRLRGKVKDLGDPSPEALKLVRRITDSVGIRPNFKLMAARIETNVLGFATIRHGRRLIVYNREAYPDNPGRTSWRHILTLAHEVGHHISSHLLVDEYSGHEQELEVDRFAGFAMHKLGAPLEQVTATFWDWPASDTHPSGLARKEAVADGWRHAKAMQALEGPRCKPGWIGGELNVNGTTCRIVQKCEGQNHTPQLACRGFDGVWRKVR